jgi:hypothetical protein
MNGTLQRYASIPLEMKHVAFDLHVYFCLLSEQTLRAFVPKHHAINVGPVAQSV